MNLRSRYKNIEYAIIAILIFGSAVVAFIAMNPHSNSGAQNDFATQKEYWKDRITKVGGETAYKEFLYQSNALKDRNVLHMRAHVFGGVLYQVEGISGMGICDGSFWFGCVHEYIGEALNDHGLAFMPTLLELCSKTRTPRSCVHSAGHGITAFVGYSSSSIPTILNSCKEHSFTGAVVQQCITGALMEYFIGSVGNGGILHTRAADADVYAPCSKMEGDDARTCYYVIPTWWHSLMQGDSSDAIFQTIAYRCSSMKGDKSKYKDQCMQGLGFTAGIHLSQFDNTQEQRYCMNALFAPRDEMQCTSVLAYVNTLSRGASSISKVCALIPDQKAECEQQARHFLELGL